MPVKDPRIVSVSILSLLAVWPIGQWCLAEYCDVNPWKLCGFAMYCTPHKIVVDVVDTTDGRRVLSESELLQASNNQFADFVSYREHLGTLTSPDAVARSILQSSPDIKSLLIVIHVMQLDPATSTLAVRSREYEYDEDSS